MTNNDKIDLPYQQYWNILKDSLKFSLTEKEKNDVTLDTTLDFKIIRGHFTDKDKNEIILQRTFWGSKGGTFETACLFSYEQNNWKFERFICEDTIVFIDIDKDSIYELYYSEVWAGNGSVDTEDKIISIKDNNIKFLFEGNSTDNQFNVGAFTISKVGDTIINVAKYSFYETDRNKPLKLKESRQIGIKKGISKNMKNLLIDYKFIEKEYTLENEQYK